MDLVWLRIDIRLGMWETDVSNKPRYCPYLCVGVCGWVWVGVGVGGCVGGGRTSSYAPPFCMI